MQVQSLRWEDPLEEEMATHSSVLAGIIPWTEEPDELQSMGHDVLILETMCRFCRRMHPF